MTEIAKKQYNYCMDFLKGIACIFVVFIHVKFPGDFGQAVQAIARFAVPFFFMVSGYYCYRKDYQGVMVGGGKKIWHIVKITFFAYLFYIVVALIDNHFLGGTKQFDFSFTRIINAAIYSVPNNVPQQLWFLIALLEVYIIYLFIDVFHARKVAYYLAAITIAILLILSQLSRFLGYEFGPGYYRNAWIEGFSFFTLGYFLHEKQGKITINNVVLIIIIVISAILSVVERFGFERVSAVHLSTYPLVVGLFVYAIKNPEQHKGVVQRIGKKYSMYVYILHMFWWHWFDRWAEAFSLEENMLVMWLRPLIVLGLALLMSMGCYALFNRGKHKQIANN